MVVIRGERFRDRNKERNIRQFYLPLKSVSKGGSRLARRWPGFLYGLVPGGISYLPSGSWPMNLVSPGLLHISFYISMFVSDKEGVCCHKACTAKFADKFAGRRQILGM